MLEAEGKISAPNMLHRRISRLKLVIVPQQSTFGCLATVFRHSTAGDSIRLFSTMEIRQLSTGCLKNYWRLVQSLLYFCLLLEMSKNYRANTYELPLPSFNIIYSVKNSGTSRVLRTNWRRVGIIVKSSRQRRSPFSATGSPFSMRLSPSTT